MDDMYPSTTRSFPNSHDDEESMTIGMAYVPWQKFRKLYEPELGFHRGTVFQELDKPFLGEEAIPQ